MAEVNLLRSLPSTKRQNLQRGDTPDVVRAARQFGALYFDGPRACGYGGYHYDGRWIPVARDIVAHYDLQPGMRVLDVGCAKGFLVKDLMKVCPGLEAFGLDISTYAVTHCEPEVIGRLHVGSADAPFPFPDMSFDAVLSVNTIHNLDRDGCVRALRELRRVARDPKNCFVQVDAWTTEEEKTLFESWCLTAITYLTPEEWFELFREAGYVGDHHWTILKG